MVGKVVYSQILIFILGIFLLFSNTIPAFSAENFKITKITSDAKFIEINGSSSVQLSNPKIIRLSNPARMIFDFENTVLTVPKKILNLNNSGINNIVLAQYSANPNIVRIVFKASSKDSLKKLSFEKFKNSIIFKIKEKTATKIANKKEPYLKPAVNITKKPPVAGNGTAQPQFPLTQKQTKLLKKNLLQIIRIC